MSASRFQDVQVRFCTYVLVAWLRTFCLLACATLYDLICSSSTSISIEHFVSLCAASPSEAVSKLAQGKYRNMHECLQQGMLRWSGQCISPRFERLQEREEGEA